MKKSTFFTLLFTISIIHFSEAKIWRVNNNTSINADFASFTDAITAAAVGDTIYLEPSDVSYGSAVIDKQLVIIGNGYFLDQNSNTNADTRVAETGLLSIGPGSENSVLIGLYINVTAGANYCVYIYETQNITIRRCRLSRNFAWGNAINNIIINQNYMVATGEASASGTVQNCTNCIITNNIITQQLRNLQSATIENNTFTQAGVSGHIVVDGSVTNSTVRSNTFIGAAFANPFTSNTNTASDNVENIGTELDTYFVNSGSTDGKWQLADGSPAIGVGYQGANAGAFGGNSPYVLSGLPPIPRIYDISVPTNGSAGSGLDVQVKIKSQN